MRFPALRLIAVIVAASSAWTDEPPNPPEVTAEPDSDEVLLESTVDAPRMTLSQVVDLFSPHYDVAQYPMLADPKAREFMEVGTYRQFYWMLTGGERTPELKARPLLTPQDIIHEVKLSLRTPHPSIAAFQQRYGDTNVTGLAFPERPIIFFRGTPANVSGASSWDFRTDKPRADMDTKHVFARVRYIVEAADGSYWEESMLWQYEPELNKFEIQSYRFSDINDGLSMLMRLHAEDDPTR